MVVVQWVVGMFVGSCGFCGCQVVESSPGGSVALLAGEFLASRDLGGSGRSRSWRPVGNLAGSAVADFAGAFPASPAGQGMRGGSDLVGSRSG